MKELLKKHPARQDAPPAAGCISSIFRSAAVRSSRSFFYCIGELSYAIKRVSAVFIALTFWQLAAMFIHQKILLVSPIEVFLRLLTIWREPGFFLTLWFTLSHIAGGFLIGLILGIICAFAAYHFNFFETLLWPWVATVKSVPVASFVVICLIWLTPTDLSIFISFLITWPMIYQNTLTGLKQMDHKMLEMAALFRLTPLHCLRYIIIPEVKSYLFSAVSVSIGMAWKAGVAAEIIGTPNGSIGKALYNAKIWLDTDDLLAWTVIIVLISVLSEKFILLILRHLLRIEASYGSDHSTFK